MRHWTSTSGEASFVVWLLDAFHCACRKAVSTSPLTLAYSSGIPDERSTAIEIRNPLIFSKGSSRGSGITTLTRTLGVCLEYWLFCEFWGSSVISKEPTRCLL